MLFRSCFNQINMYKLTVENIDLNLTNIENYFTIPYYKAKVEKKVDLKEWCKFVGFLISKGYYVKLDHIYGSVHIHYSQQPFLFSKKYAYLRYKNYISRSNT